jgi:hypothetical protein
MKGMELQALVCARCLLGVEKVGRDWVEEGEAKEAKAVKEMEEVSERAVGWVEEKICGFGEDNMREFTTKLARE